MLLSVLAALVSLLVAGSAVAGTLPPGFQESIALSGLNNPTVVRFASDGRVFVAEKGGLVKVFDSNRRALVRRRHASQADSDGLRLRR